jgi:hypothetical protein
MDKATLDRLTEKHLQVIITYAPAGLGHLRITDAIYHGLPPEVKPIILGSQDESIKTMHRITSVNPVGHAIFDWLQKGPLSSYANRAYRAMMRSGTKGLYRDMVRLVEERFEPPRKILVVATHFDLAHKLAAIKDDLQRALGATMRLVVFVSDDTFQHVWHVDGADLLVVTSNFIKRQYDDFSWKTGRRIRVEVAPYPMSQRMTVLLGSDLMLERIRQLSAGGSMPIHVSIPISGAAVGMAYSSILMERLHGKSDRFRFHITTREAPYTRLFLSLLRRQPWVELHLGRGDRDVVEQYETLYQECVLSLEVTKPSEHAFKAVLDTQSRGGVILLFSEPVGSQEDDNLDFLVRLGVLPDRATNERYWEMSETDAPLEIDRKIRLLNESHCWRGIRLPNDPIRAANFIWWMLRSDLLAQMMVGNQIMKVKEGPDDPVQQNGVDEFWKLASSI